MWEGNLLGRGNSGGKGSEVGGYDQVWGGARGPERLGWPTKLWISRRWYHITHLSHEMNCRFNFWERSGGLLGPCWAKEWCSSGLHCDGITLALKETLDYKRQVRKPRDQQGDQSNYKGKNWWELSPGPTRGGTEGEKVIRFQIHFKTGTESFYWWVKCGDDLL